LSFTSDDDFARRIDASGWLRQVRPSDRHTDGMDQPLEQWETMMPRSHLPISHFTVGVVDSGAAWSFLSHLAPIHPGREFGEKRLSS
jgi:hypothetical protein